METKLQLIISELAKGAKIVRQSGIIDRIFIVNGKNKKRTNYIHVMKLLNDGIIKKTYDFYPVTKYELT